MLSYIYTVEKTVMLKYFCNSSGTDIGEDTITQNENSISILISSSEARKKGETQSSNNYSER